MKSVFEKYLSNTPKYANQIQIQIQIFHLAGFQTQIQIQIQIFAYLNTNTNTYLTPALRLAWVTIIRYELSRKHPCHNWLFNSLTSCVGSCYQTETANQWVCGTGSWWVTLTLRYSHSLEWFWVSRRIFIYSHHDTIVFFDVRLSVSLSVDWIASALYLEQYSSDPFHICTSYQATSGVSRVMFV